MINSKKKGCKYELDVMHIYKKRFINCKTSRNESKSQDDLWVDLCNTWNFNIQCKSYKNFSVWKAIEVLKSMPKNKINIVHCKITHKGSVVIIDEKDWISFFNNLQTNNT